MDLTETTEGAMTKTRDVSSLQQLDATEPGSCSERSRVSSLSDGFSLLAPVEQWSRATNYPKTLQRTSHTLSPMFTASCNVCPETKSSWGGSCHSADRGTSKISLPSVTSQGADCSVLHQSTSVVGPLVAFCTKLDLRCPKMKKLKKSL